MPSIIPGFEYDIFISYRHNDNRSGWVTEFINSLEEELAATIKEPLTIYFDKNPHDGLHEHHDVDDSLKDKLKCLIFIPILSRTYCDPKSFAFEHEFKAFVQQASQDQFGLKIKLASGNTAGRVMPLRIHELEEEDVKLFETEVHAVLRPIDFIFKATGVNRALLIADKKEDNLNHTIYRDQVNKVANAIREIIYGIKNDDKKTTPKHFKDQPELEKEKFTEGFLKNRKPVWIAASIIILALIAAYFLFFSKSFTNVPGNESDSKKVIAVLPFKLIGDDKEGKHIADGVADALINHLTGIKGLVVRSRTSVEQYADTKKAIPEIAEELKADYILEGSAQKYKDDIRIIVQLIDAKTDDHVWHNEYNKKFDDIFNVQSEIAQLISSSLKVKLSPNEKEQLSRIPTTNMDAWNLYLQAESKYVDWAYHNTGKKGYDEVMNLSDKALALDPKLAEAYVTKASIYFNANWLQQLQYENYMDSLVLWCNKALAGNPDAAGPYIVLGYYLLNTGKDEEAKKHFEKARELAPNELFAYWGLSSYYDKLGKREEQFINLKKVLELATQSVWLPGLYDSFSGLYLSICDFNKSIEFREKADKLGYTDYANKVWIYACMDDKEKARIAAYEKEPNSIKEAWAHWYYYKFFEPENAMYYYDEILKLDSNSILSSGEKHRYAYVLWASGKKEEGLKEFEKAEKEMLNMKKLGRNVLGLYYDLACIYSFLGKKEKALEYLRSYSDHPWPWGLPYFIDVDPLFNNIRSDPEFQKIVADAKEKTVRIRERIRELEKE